MSNAPKLQAARLADRAQPPFPTRPNWIDVDLSALDHNVSAVRSLLRPGTRIHACVKSSAYGFDVVEVSKRFHGLGVEALCCGTFEEAAAIRAALPKAQLIMFGAALPEGMPDYLEHGLTPTIHNLELAEAVSRHSTAPTKVHVKVDFGWGRLGFALPVAKQSILKIARMPRIEIEAVYTHLPFTDASGRSYAQQRTSEFCEFVEDLRREGLVIPITQARASNAVMMGLTDSCNAIAAGSILYGKSSAPRDMTDFSQLKPVLKAVRSKLIHVLPDFPGKTVGRTTGVHGRPAPAFSGATGVIPFGRRDGYASATAGQTAYVLIRNDRAPVLAVNSELSVIDLSKVDDPRIGEEVVIMGGGENETITLDEVAKWQGVGLTDVLVRMSGRTPRVFHG